MIVKTDYDGTICRSIDEILAVLNLVHHTTHSAYDVRGWNFWEDEPFRSEGYTKEEFYRAADMVRERGWTAATRPYDKDTIRVLDRLIKDGATILTGTPKQYSQSIIRWLVLHGCTVPPIDHVASQGDKMNHDWDWLLEDNGDLAEAHMRGDHGYTGTLILLSTPWNRHVKADGVKVVRVDGWAEVEALIYGHAA